MINPDKTSDFRLIAKRIVRERSTITRSELLNRLAPEPYRQPSRHREMSWVIQSLIDDRTFAFDVQTDIITIHERTFRKVRDMPIPRRVNPLVKRLFKILRKREMSVSELGYISGLSFRTINEWKSRNTPSLNNFEACLNALGYRLKIEKIPNNDNTRNRHGNDRVPKQEQTSQ